MHARTHAHAHRYYTYARTGTFLIGTEACPFAGTATIFLEYSGTDPVGAPSTCVQRHMPAVCSNYRAVRNKNEGHSRAHARDGICCQSSA